MDVMKVKLSIDIFREGERFIAYSAALDLSTSGETFEQAKTHFDEAATMFLEEAASKGNIDRVLTELGWQKNVGRWQPPALISQEEREVHVPA